MIIGGTGKKRTPALAARHAAEFNVPFESVDMSRELFARVREACDEAGSSRAYLQVLDLADLDHLDLVASEVMPHM